MLIVTGTIAVPPDTLAAFVADFRVLATATRRRDGCLAYDAAVLDAAEGQLLVADRWRDEASLAKHIAAADTSAFVAGWGGCMNSNVRLYHADNGRALAGD